MSTQKIAITVPPVFLNKLDSWAKNVLLQKGEANLPSKSLARCSHVMVIDKSRLLEKTGTVPKKKCQEIISHIIWVLRQGKIPA